MRPRAQYAGAGVANVMKDAGLAHDGFYAHFRSRDALLAAAVEPAGAKGRRDCPVAWLPCALQRAFPAATPADLAWVLNAYTVVYATMLIPAGGLADTHGRKRLFLAGGALLLAASAACGMAGSVATLIAARAVQALGAALLTPASLSIILDAVQREKRTAVINLWGAVGGAGGSDHRDQLVGVALPLDAARRDTIASARCNRQIKYIVRDLISNA
jgi:MFS family permease